MEWMAARGDRKITETTLQAITFAMSPGGTACTPFSATLSPCGLDNLCAPLFNSSCVRADGVQRDAGRMLVARHQRNSSLSGKEGNEAHRVAANQPSESRALLSAPGGAAAEQRPNGITV